MTARCLTIAGDFFIASFISDFDGFYERIFGESNGSLEIVLSTFSVSSPIRFRTQFLLIITVVFGGKKEE